MLPILLYEIRWQKQSFMHFDTIHKIMKDMDGQYIVQLEGGEPTTHPQFYLLMEYISTLEKVEEIVIDTNALTLDRHIDKIAEIRFENKGKMYKKSRIASDDEYLSRLDDILNRLRPLNPSISITGGEPTKSRRLVPILGLIEKYGYRKRTLTTNGSGLFDIVENKPILQHIADNHFQHLNISKAHFDEDTNKRIMQYENGYCSNDDIYRIAIFAKANNLRPRMSCLLLKEGINNMDGIIRYLDYYNSLCIDNVIFRETMDYDERAMRNHDKMAYLKENKVYLNDIWKCIDKDNRFTPIKQLLGYYYYVEVYKYQNIDMVSESANLVKLYEQKQIANDVVFEMIFHPNGNLNGSWVDDEDILLAYNPYKS